MLAVAVIIEWLILNMDECLLQMIDLFPKLEVFNEMHVSRMLVTCKFSSSEQSQVSFEIKYQSLRMTMCSICIGVLSFLPVTTSTFALCN